MILACPCGWTVLLEKSAKNGANKSEQSIVALACKNREKSAENCLRGSWAAFRKLAQSFPSANDGRFRTE